MDPGLTVTIMQPSLRFKITVTGTFSYTAPVQTPAVLPKHKHPPPEHGVLANVGPSYQIRSVRRSSLTPRLSSHSGFIPRSGQAMYEGQLGHRNTAAVLLLLSLLHTQHHSLIIMTSQDIQPSESPAASPPKTDIEMGPLPSTPKSNDISQLSLIVAFTEPHDAENPMQWPDRQKWAVTNVLSATGFNRIMVSTIMAPALHLIAAELNMNATEAAMSLSIYLLATAFGPLLIGPLSELYGRQVVLHASNMWFLIWNIVCGFATTKGMLIAARLRTSSGPKDCLISGPASDTKDNVFPPLTVSSRRPWGQLHLRPRRRCAQRRLAP
jgi:MFS transporter